MIEGSLHPGFEAVAEEFRRNFTERGDVGAAVTVYHHGRPVVDLWGGEARPGQPWAEDTMACVFSTTKGVTSFVVQLLYDRGDLHLDAPITEYWPEFGAAGKAAITTRDVLSHRSGAITFPDYLDMLELDDPWAEVEMIAERIAKASPLWEPASRHGYHALTFGWILGEVVRRITGESLGTVFRKEVAEPLGLDFWIGVPDEHHHRVADLVDAPPPTDAQVAAYLALFNPGTWTGRAHFVGPDGVHRVAEAANTAAYRSAEIPAGGGVGTARSLARLYALLAARGTLDGVTLVSPESVDAFTAQHVRGPDAVLLLETRYGLGYSRPTEMFPYGPNDGAFGHGGLGGSLAFADPEAAIAFAYVPNQLLFPSLDDTPRSYALIDAVYASL